MSKRKKPNNELDALMSNMADMVDQMNEEQLAMLHSVLSGDVDFDDQTNMIYYHYERPDYSLQIQPYGRWLLPFKDVEPEDTCIQLFERVEATGQGLPLEQKRQDIRSFLYELFLPFDPSNKSYKETGIWQLFGPLWLLERLHLTDCLDIVLEALRQEAHFFSAQIDGLEDWFATVLYQLGHDQLETLESFLREGHLVPRAKPICFDAIVLTMLHQPRQRMKALSILSKYLKYIHTICLQGADPYNIEHYAISLATAHVKELMPSIRQLYADLDIPAIELSEGIHELEEMMNDTSLPFIIDHDSLDAALREPEAEDDRDLLGQVYDWLDDDGNWQDDDEDDFDIADIYDDSLPQKRYTVSVELQDAPQPVTRTLQVPSNIYLSALAELLMITFEWKVSSEQYVFNDGTSLYKQTNGGTDGNDLFDNVCDAEQHTLGEFLKKRSDTILFNTLGSHGNVWQNIIRLDKSGRYKAETERLIVLLGAKGIYPNKSISSMDDYAHHLTKGLLRETNMMKVREALRDFEDEHTYPF